MPTASARRQALLEAAMTHVTEHGIGELSLRELAAALGTSHRMLSHHFGSKEGLWVAIVQEMEARQRAAVQDLLPRDGRSLADAMRAWWAHISHESLWPHERLFYEVYAQALQGRPHTETYLEHVVDGWLEPIAEINVAYGVPEDRARPLGRLALGVIRGLLLDLLATGDVDGVGAAMDAFIDGYVALAES